MSTYRVFLRRNTHFETGEALYSEFDMVAIIGGIDHHGYVSMIAQNVDTPWHEDPRVKLSVKGQEIVASRGGLRSFSTGDIVAENVGEKKEAQKVYLWIATPDGFSPVNIEWRDCQEWFVPHD